jgi:F-type H+-transporting ATPase subunit epsilon
VSERLQLEIVTPSRRLLDEAADEVRLPGALGELGVLPGHTPLLTALGTGAVSYFQGAQMRQLAVQGGFAEVLPDRVTVLARIAETPAEIDVAAARAALAEATAALPTAAADDIARLTDAVRLATTRIEVGRRTG